MLNHYKIITVTHKRISLKNICDFVVKTTDEKDLRGQLDELKAAFELPELLYLATCNRVMYFFTSDQNLDEQFLYRFFRQVNPTLSDEQLYSLNEKAYQLEGMEALRHLYEVAASIDSLVIGERQILGQLREAYDQCKSWGLTGDDLRMAVQQAVVTAKGVYSTTQIGDKPVSIVSLAIQKMLHAHVAKDARILLIGAGQTNLLVAKFLKKHGFERVTVFNRTIGKAINLAAMLDGQALPIRALQDYQGGFDCMIVCTGSIDPIVTPELYERLLQGESGQKVLIDLAIPHNVDMAVVERFRPTYIEIDGLRNSAKENLAFREQEVKKAQALLEEYIEEFPVLYRQRQMEIAMREVPVQIKAVKSKAINEVFHKEISSLDDQSRDLMERMLAYMEKKCIGIPMKAVREGLT